MEKGRVSKGSWWKSNLSNSGRKKRRPCQIIMGEKGEGNELVTEDRAVGYFVDGKAKKGMGSGEEEGRKDYCFPGKKRNKKFPKKCFATEVVGEGKRTPYFSRRRSQENEKKRSGRPWGTGHSRGGSSDDFCCPVHGKKAKGRFLRGKTGGAKD